MPGKRRRSETGWESTGGTGDVRPQWYSTSAVQSANDTTTTTTVNSPPGIGLQATGAKKFLAMEILKVLLDVDSASLGTTSSLRVYISSKNFATTEPSLRMGDATVIASFHQQFQLATSGADLNNYPLVLDMTDGAGHGILYANQNIFIQIASTSTSSTNQIRIKMLYREVYINEAELLGLVLQSNQN